MNNTSLKSDLGGAFRWFAEPPERRDPAIRDWLPGRLESLWGVIREQMGPEKFDSVFGDIRPGRFTMSSDRCWAQTNDERGPSFVNLTLNAYPGEFALNVNGSFDPQLEKVESWLRKPSAWRFLRGLPNWWLVIFVRSGHIGAGEKVVFQGAPREERERMPISSVTPANIPTTLAGLRRQLDSNQKLALHIRRSWTAEEVAALDDIPATLTEEVERWIEPLQEIRTS